MRYPHIHPDELNVWLEVIQRLGGDPSQVVIKKHPYDDNVYVYYGTERVIIPPATYAEMTHAELVGFARQICWKPAPFTKRSKRQGWKARRSPVTRFWT